MTPSPFSHRAFPVVVGISAASFVLALVLIALGGDPAGTRTAGPGAFSRSAVGHHAFVEVLKKLDIPVVVSRFRAERTVRAEDVLLLIEPRDRSRASLAAKLDHQPNVLVVLPKWSGKASPENGNWISQVRMLPDPHVDQAIAAMGIDGVVVRPSGEPRWRSALGERPILPRAQLVQSPDLTPLVASDEGILIGEVRRPGRDGRLILLSDPDLIATHGLGRGANARIALQAVEGLRAGRGRVVVDETIHGFEYRPSLWAELLSFPLSIFTTHLVLLAFIALWAGNVRFGAAEVEDAAIAAGEQALMQGIGLNVRRGIQGGMRPAPKPEDLDRHREQLGCDLLFKFFDREAYERFSSALPPLH